MADDDRVDSIVVLQGGSTVTLDCEETSASLRFAPSVCKSVHDGRQTARFGY